MNNSPKFLELVAAYLIEKNADLSSLTLIFPNKRSAMFLKKYMHDILMATSARPRFMPRFATMGNFVSRHASRPEMPRTEQLFLLYDCYRTLLAERGHNEQLRDFDKFIFWGNMILDDFDDVDRQLVDAAKLFKNLEELKESNADYLDDEQKSIVRQLWGESPRTAAVTEFWSHVNYNGEDSPEQRFITLWQLLGDLYRSFVAAIHARGYDTAGGQLRDAAAAISSSDAESLSSRRYAFIGFNDLSNAEMLILKRLNDIGAADFFWDFDSAMLDLALEGRLASQLRRLKQIFPMPADFDASPCPTLPKIEVMAVPSDIAQAKAVTDIIDRWSNDRLINRHNAINTAVVLPDENLLTPVLMSIPETIPAVNITMGVPFSASAFASMLHSIISMQLRARQIRGRIHYYYADVMELLSHPHVHVIAPSDAEDIKRFISKNNLFNLDATELCEKYPALTYLFTPVKAADDPKEICSYMTALIDGLSTALKANAKPSQGGLPELEMLDYFRNGLEELNCLIAAYSVTMNESTYFALFEKMMQSRRIDLQGTPLRGMQVMGVLETRSLDFDNIIILSMNENSFPRKSYMRTMIPNNLRIGYGMTTIDRQDALYTYYFYRLLSRAKQVKLVYDSRTQSLGAGETSRFIAQLRHIAPPGTVSFSTLHFPSDVSSPAAISVTKDKDVMHHLQRFMPGGNANLSASALKEYKKCRLKFYLRYVRNLRGEDNVTDYITASAYGTIVHNVFETLFKQFEQQTITADTISSILDTPGYLDNVIADTVFRLYYRNASSYNIDRMPAEGAVTCSVINLYIRKILEIERQECISEPFRYIKGELEVKSPPAWIINDNLAVNFKMSIDRVDMAADGSLRFIDYKTGSDKVADTTVEKIFKRERTDDDATFQLLTYCLAYHDMTGSDVAIKPVVYPFRTIAAENAVPAISIDGTEVTDYRSVEPEFRQQLFAMIEEIFSPDMPFDQACDDATCRFCPFADLCGRQPKDID